MSIYADFGLIMLCTWHVKTNGFIALIASQSEHAWKHTDFFSHQYVYTVIKAIIFSFFFQLSCKYHN